MHLSNLETILEQHQRAGTLDASTIAAAMSSWEYLYTIRSMSLKKAIFQILLQECPNTTTAYVD